MNIIKGHQDNRFGKDFIEKRMESLKPSLHGQLVAKSNLSESKLNTRGILIGLFLFIWTMPCYITPFHTTV